MNPIERVQVLGGVRTTVITRSQLADKMLLDCRSELKNKKPKLIFSSNGQGIDLYNRCETFKEWLEQADLVHADGMSVVYASKFFHKQNGLEERVATTDFFHDAARAAEGTGVSFYFLGATDARIQKAVERIQKMYPDLLISGYRNGYFEKGELPTIAQAIEESGADVVWVGIGRPRQEDVSCWLKENSSGPSWIKTCGGLFDFLSGDAPRAPLWMQRSGLEWLFRMLREPRRLGLRYMTTNIRASYYLLTRSK